MKDKMKGKLDNHFHIFVNGRKCKILNYKTEDDCLTIITKIKNQNLWVDSDKEAEICIEDENKRYFFFVKCLSVFCDTTIFRYCYSILQEHIENKTF